MRYFLQNAGSPKINSPKREMKQEILGRRNLPPSYIMWPQSAQITYALLLQQSDINLQYRKVSELSWLRPDQNLS
jgi:hypothetical protein